MTRVSLSGALENPDMLAPMNSVLSSGGAVNAVAIHSAARDYGLPDRLVAAIITVETGGADGAVRFEPEYRWLWDCQGKKAFRVLTGSELQSLTPPPDFAAIANESRATEWIGQRMSWGPMQIMGATARMLGFCRQFGDLCIPARGLDMGCNYLNYLRERYYKERGWPSVVAAYNAGSPREQDDGKFTNQSYVDKIELAGGFDA